MRRFLANKTFFSHLRLLHWFVLSWVLFVGLGDIAPFHPAFIILLLIHLMLYLWLFARYRAQQWWCWFSLPLQAGLILLLTSLSQDLVTLFVLSLTWSVAALVTLKNTFSRLLAVGGYILLLGLSIFLGWRVFHWMGTTIYPINYLFALSLFLGTLSLVFYLQQWREHKETQTLLHDLDVAHAQLTTYALRIEELTTVAERQRLARELHDTLSQGLVGLLMQLDAANAHFEQHLYSQGHAIITKAIERARSMLTETRYVISDLRTGTVIHVDDLPELTQEEIERFTAATSIPCQSDLNALVMTPQAYCEQVMRVITEGLMNIARHAQAQQVWVNTYASREIIEVEIRDDGIGFDPQGMVNVPGHYGLIGLRERARIAHGQMDITSAPGEGTSIRLRIPRGNVPQNHDPGLQDVQSTSRTEGRDS